MYVHMFTKVWEQMRGGWNMHRNAHVCAQLWQRGSDRPGVRLTCLHVLKHEHLLTQIWIRRGLGGMHTGYTHLHMTMPRG